MLYHRWREHHLVGEPVCLCRAPQVVVSLVAQNCCWIGFYDLLENYNSGGTAAYVDKSGLQDAPRVVLKKFLIR